MDQITNAMVCVIQSHPTISTARKRAAVEVLTGPGESYSLTMREVAAKFRVSKRTIIRWAQSGRLVAKRVGRVTRFDVRDVERLLAGAHR